MHFFGAENQCNRCIFFVKSFVRFVAVVAKTTNCDFANFAEMMWNSSFYQLKASFQIVSRPPTCQFALLHFSVKLSCHSSPCSGNFGHFTRKYLGLKLIIFLEFKLLQGLQTSFKKGFRKKPAQNHKRRKFLQFGEFNIFFKNDIMQNMLGHPVYFVLSAEQYSKARKSSLRTFEWLFWVLKYWENQDSFMWILMRFKSIFWNIQ